MIRPIFIFSMPRSGSTLLQTLLMSHNKISSHAEPWFLLNLVSLYGFEGTKSKFGYSALRVAVDDIIKSLKNQEKDMITYIRDFSLNIYQNLSDESAIYFLDKTPRYFFIIDYISKIFPEAKFIFLTRNPLETVASYIPQFNGSTIKSFDLYDFDFDEGFEAIVNGYNKYQSKSILVRYEDIVGENKEKVIQNIFEYLELELDLSVFDKYKYQDLKGRMGDTNIQKTSSVQKENEKWKTIVYSNHRKKTILNILNKVTDDYYKLSHFNKEEVLNMLESHKTSFKIQDCKDYYLNAIRKNIKNQLGWCKY